MELTVFHVGEISGMKADDMKDVEEFVSACPYVIIATNNKDTGARLSALAPLPGSSMEGIYFATDAKSQKVVNLLHNPDCEIIFTDGQSQVIYSGKGEVFTDMETKKAKWMDWMIDYFPDGVEGETMCVLKFVPSSARIMLG